MSCTVDPGKTRSVEVLYDGTSYRVYLKEQLSYGERMRLSGSAIRSYSRREGAQDGDDALGMMEMNVNIEMASLEKMRTWIASWTLTDSKGVVLPITIEAIRALKEDLGQLVEQVVDKHASEVSAATKKSSLTLTTPVSAEPVKTS